MKCVHLEQIFRRKRTGVKRKELEMKYLRLTQNKRSLVDNEEYNFLSQFKFCAHKTRGGKWYAEHHFIENGKRKIVFMHQLVLGFFGKMYAGVIDHINHDGLDNRRANLRVVSKSVDLRNRRVFKNNIVGCTGVSYDKRYKGNPYRVQFHRDGKMIYLGTFKSLFQARAVAKQFIMA